MADKDNTSVVDPQEGAPVNQDTATEETTNEPVATETESEALEKKEPELIFGKYKSIEDAQEAFGHIQARATKAEQSLKDLKKEMRGKTREEIKALDYDKQLEYLINKVQEYEDKMSEMSSEIEGESQDSSQGDAKQIKTFISKHPLLAETGLDEEFELIATHPSMQEYTLESIYEVRIKPKLEKLMGTKITTKERKLVGSSSKPEPEFKDVSKMSNQEYEKHRSKIMATAGIK
jgi:hypothetical protein